ncbi:MAG: acyl-CoA carboxylase subunit beta, partial [Alphaproteobacteria bacterium]|nr:acyl-CoA carboxylase subunit beta [Alphaproteobacteria bacterium]
MLGLVDQFRSLEQAVRDNSARRRERFHERGQLLPRERVALLLDRGTPFVELSTLAGYKMHDDDGGKNIAGGCNIVGIGYVSGTRCMISASDSGITGG